MSFFKFPRKTSPSQARTDKPGTNNDSVVFDGNHDHHDHHDVSSSDSYDDGGDGDGGDSD